MSAAGIGALVTPVSDPLLAAASDTTLASDAMASDAVVHVADRHAPGDIVELFSTSEVFIPPKGESWMKFSFDFPEPAVVFGDHRFSFLVFTAENTYAMDRSLMRAAGNADVLELTCTGMVWAGGQEKSAGSDEHSSSPTG